MYRSVKGGRAVSFSRVADIHDNNIVFLFFAVLGIDEGVDLNICCVSSLTVLLKIWRTLQWSYFQHKQTKITQMTKSHLYLYKLPDVIDNQVQTLVLPAVKVKSFQFILSHLHNGTVNVNHIDLGNGSMLQSFVGRDQFTATWWYLVVKQFDNYGIFIGIGERKPKQSNRN